MAKYLCGAIVKHTRKNKGLTQQQLCDLLNGACSIPHLSRIERSINSIEIHMFDVIMEKLGENPRKYYTVLETNEELTLTKLKDEVETLIFHGKYTEAEKIIDLLEAKYKKRYKNQNSIFEEALDKQCIMNFRAMVIVGTKIASEDLYDYLTDAIKITIPDFDLVCIKDYFLTMQELEIINMIAITYGRTDRQLQAIDILYSLKSNVERNYNDELQKSIIFQVILYNLSKYLGLQEKYYEAINICDTAINYAVMHNRLKMVPKLIYNKAYCVFYLGDKHTSQILLTRCYYIFQGFNDFNTAEKVKELSTMDFQLEILEQYY